MRALLVSAVLAAAAGAAHAEPGGSWLEGEHATGDWGGGRTWLAEDGVELEVAYTAEALALARRGDAAYRGNLDLIATLDSDGLGLYPGGTLVVYGQHAHGGGVSDELGAGLPVSNLEAEAFTQLSELWLEQRFGAWLRVRVGKQESNRDVASPRFAGNFVNSSWGALPSVPMPTFPAPGLGALVGVRPAGWLELRGHAFEGAPAVGSLGESAFEGGAGALVIGDALVEHGVAGHPGGRHTVGAWYHSGTDERGVFGTADMLVALAPRDDGAPRSVQVFARGGWTPGADDVASLYAGAGLTVHGFVGRDNTVGVGAGWARFGGDDEGFIEAFFKLRTIPWLTLEPDAQLYVTPDGAIEAVVLLRSKLTL